MKIDEEEFLEMLSNYWGWNNNEECTKKTIEYLDKIGISKHNRQWWGIE
jgi:hypothetical protein